jgi:two-component system, NtrC family, C4-dicarboxylate transport response regulator DctD
MAPIHCQPQPYAQTPWGHHLQADIDLAARRTAPVLVTAPPGYAATIVQAIAARSHRDLLPIAAPHPAAKDDVVTAIAESRLGITTSRGAILWLKEVHRFTSAQQAAVMKLVEAAQARPIARIVASSSVDLFDLVERGSFDARLFYRLNTIHLIVEMAAGE